MRIAIIGAGIMGRTLTYHLLQKKCDVTLYDRKNLYVENCSYVAAGMLSGYAEMNAAMPSLVDISSAAITYWRNHDFVASGEVFFDDQGTLCIAGEQNQPELQQFRSVVLQKTKEVLQIVKMSAYEPEINRQFSNAVYLPKEAQISAVQLMNMFAKVFLQKNKLFSQEEVLTTTPSTDLARNDWIIDCRGLGAKYDLSGLRAVRGELLLLHAPSVRIKHVIRFFHPRHHIYLIPRPNNHFIVGASCIDSEDYRDITVKTMLEHLSSAYAIHKGFAESTIITAKVHCRPAFEENLPRIYLDRANKIIRINGLYRHGYIFAPVFAEAVELFLLRNQWPQSISSFLCEKSE